MEILLLDVKGMTCVNCVRHATEALSAVAGVTAADVDLAAGEAKVTHEGASLEAMVAALADEGFVASVK